MGDITSPLYPTPPTVEQLEEFLNCSFAASLETEEGRIIAFTVDFFCEPEQSFPYRMKQPVPLSPRDLARLAVALDPWRCRICVVPSEMTLNIAGLIHLGEQFASHGTRKTLHQLSIRALGPGTPVVRYSGLLLLTYKRGRFAFHYGPSGRYGEFAVRRALSFHLHAGRTVEQLRDDLRFEAALLRIARTMLYQRHGGTLLILPEGASWEDAAPGKS
jgi:hypothetical protein